MAKRIFTSFAFEDKTTRDLFVGQARNQKVPYELGSPTCQLRSLGVTHGRRDVEQKLKDVME